MVNDVAPTVPAIGACLRCNQLFLVTENVTNCLVCGRPPDVTLPFGRFVPAGEDVELTPPTLERQAVLVEGVMLTCPQCQAVLEIRTADMVVETLVPPPLLPAEDAGPVDQPSSEPASQPAETPAPPVMAHDVFDNPIEGPPEAGYGDTGLTTEHGLEPIDQPPKPAEPPAPEEPAA